MVHRVRRVSWSVSHWVFSQHQHHCFLSRSMSAHLRCRRGQANEWVWFDHLTVSAASCVQVVTFVQIQHSTVVKTCKIKNKKIFQHRLQLYISVAHDSYHALCLWCYSTMQLTVSAPVRVQGCRIQSIPNISIGASPTYSNQRCSYYKCLYNAFKTTPPGGS